MNESADLPLAVVTGASSGIGHELARQFAEHGFDLIVAAEDDGMRVVSGSLRDKVQAQAGKPMPEPAKAKVHGSLAEPGSGASS